MRSHYLKSLFNHAALDICAKYNNFDVALGILVAVAMSRPIKVAKEIIRDAQNNDKPILVCLRESK